MELLEWELVRGELWAAAAAALAAPSHHITAPWDEKLRGRAEVTQR